MPLRLCSYLYDQSRISMIFVSVFVNDQLVDKMGNHFIALLGSSVVKMWNLILHVMQSICLYPWDCASCYSGENVKTFWDVSKRSSFGVHESWAILLIWSCRCQFLQTIYSFSICSCSCSCFGFWVSFYFPSSFFSGWLMQIWMPQVRQVSTLCTVLRLFTWFVANSGPYFTFFFFFFFSFFI